MLSRSDLEELQSLEEGMWRSEARGDREWMGTGWVMDFHQGTPAEGGRTRVGPA